MLMYLKYTSEPHDLDRARAALMALRRYLGPAFLFGELFLVREDVERGTPQGDFVHALFEAYNEFSVVLAELEKLSRDQPRPIPTSMRRLVNAAAAVLNDHDPAMGTVGWQAMRELEQALFPPPLDAKQLACAHEPAAGDAGSLVPCMKCGAMVLA